MPALNLPDLVHRLGLFAGMLDNVKGDLSSLPLWQYIKGRGYQPLQRFSYSCSLHSIGLLVQASTLIRQSQPS